MTQWYLIITLVAASLFGLQRGPSTAVVATPFSSTTPGHSEQSLPQGPGGLRVNDIQKSIISEVKTLWASNGGGCQPMTDLPEVVTKLRALRGTFSVDQMAILNHLFMPRSGEEAASGQQERAREMLNLWKKFEKRYPRTPENVKAVLRGREYWIGQLARISSSENETMIRDQLQINKALFEPDFTVGFGCCSDGFCGDGAISIPLEAFLIDKKN